MLILSVTDVIPVTLSTPWGKEDGIRYGRSAFLPVQTYPNIAAAIESCRKDLDAGLMSIIVKDGNKVGLWCPLPDLMQGHKLPSAA